MRVIGSGLAVFLAVTVILLYQLSSDEHRPVAVAGVDPVQSTATAPLPPPPATATPFATTTPQPAIPTRIPPTATPVYVEPTVEWAEPEVVEEEPIDDAVAWVDEEPLDEVADEEPDVASASSINEVHDVGLAALDESNEWAGAIETPNGGLIGTVLSSLANVRTTPTVDADIIDVLHGGWPVAIYGATLGDFVSGTDLWYEVNGGYVSATLIGPFAALTPDVTYAGHWVDVDLSRNVAVAYINDTPVNAVTIITGKDGFETPIGAHTIFSRVVNETLDSATVGIPVGDPEHYYLPDVPYTQYFADDGFAIHANYWSDPWQFGGSFSHGCVNMYTEDAEWFWWFLDIGSVVNVHY